MTATSNDTRSLQGPSYSEQIRACRDGVVRNPYQGTDKKVVFVCSMGILRSATGARLYAHRYNTRTAGTWSDALIPLTPILMAWADELVFVNHHNYEQVKHSYEEEGHPGSFDKDFNIKVLDIPDAYEHMHPELIKAFHEQYEPLEQVPTMSLARLKGNSVWDYADSFKD
jgi:predicted protein tyrosine phosphatase